MRHNSVCVLKTEGDHLQTVCVSECVCFLCHLLDSLRCDDGGDGAPLLHHHSLLMTRVDRLAVQVAGSRLCVCLKRKKEK